ncbi:MAG TPA: hypothetical protein VFY24_09335 [Azospira sp.]|nr:hypothetical protein [Azospira sp.]
MPAYRDIAPKACLKDVLGVLDMIDVEFFYAEGLAMGDAEAQIAALA